MGRIQDNKLIEEVEQAKMYACYAVVLDYGETGHPSFSTFAFAKTTAR
jgi:hypothetical protein